MLKKIVNNTLYSLLLFSSLCAEEEILVDGVSYEIQKTKKPQTIHVLRVDPNKARICCIHALNECLGKERLSVMAMRSGAIAAINGGFYADGGEFNGKSSGMLKVHGKWIASTMQPRVAMGWKKDGTHAVFDRILLETTLTCGKKKYHARDINRWRGDHEAILFTADYHRSAPTKKEGKEVIIQNNRVIGIKHTKGESKIPENGYVLSIGPNSKIDTNEFHAGTEASVSFKVKPLLDTSSNSKKAWQECDYIIGGAPLLVKDGKVIKHYSKEDVSGYFVRGSLPRTAAGVTQDGTWIFVVVDGRNPEESIGMSLPELAKYMVSLGCIHAMNLDGGGSAAMVIDDDISNTPADNCSEIPDPDQKYERKISDAIVILPLDEDDP